MATGTLWRQSDRVEKNRVILDDDARRVSLEDEDTAPLPAAGFAPRQAAGADHDNTPRYDPRVASERDLRDRRDNRDRDAIDSRDARRARATDSAPDRRDRTPSRGAREEQAANERSRSRGSRSRSNHDRDGRDTGKAAGDDDARERYRAWRAEQVGASRTRWSPAEGDESGNGRDRRGERDAGRSRSVQDSRRRANDSGPLSPRELARPELPSLDTMAPARDVASARHAGDRRSRRRPDGWDDASDERGAPRDVRESDEWNTPRRWTDRFRIRRRRDEWDERESEDGEDSEYSELRVPARDGAARDEFDDAGSNGYDPQGSGHRRSTLRRHGRRKKAPLSLAMRARRRKRRLITWAVVGALILVAIPVINSPVGAWGADALRATLGPRLTAQIESYYFGATDALTRLKVHIFGEPKNTPWTVANATPLPTGSQSQGTPVPGRKGLPLIMPLPPITPVIAPALPGEGQWVSEGLPGPTLQIWPIPMAKSFIRPDPDRPYAVVMLVAIDMRQAQMHLVDGTTDPVAGGTGQIPAADQSASTLLAAFNGGFKISDGAFGMMADGHVYVPPVTYAATVASYSDGTVRMGLWDTPDIPTANLVSYRQNGSLLIDNGTINPATSNGAAWGAPILADIYTWRSALAMTSSGVLIYAAGNSITADTMARALLAAGAVRAMEMDINPVWVRCNTYSLQGGALVASKLRTDMYGTPTQYLVPYSRDFIYITRVMPSDWPTTDPHVSRQGG